MGTIFVAGAGKSQHQQQLRRPDPSFVAFFVWMGFGMGTVALAHSLNYKTSRKLKIVICTVLQVYIIYIGVQVPSSIKKAAVASIHSRVKISKPSSF